MAEVDVRLLRSQHLLVTDEAGGVAVLTDNGWVEIPSPLRDLVLRALSADDDDS